MYGIQERMGIQPGTGLDKVSGDNQTQLKILLYKPLQEWFKVHNARQWMSDLLQSKKEAEDNTRISDDVFNWSDVGSSTNAVEEQQAFSFGDADDHNDQDKNADEEVDLNLMEDEYSPVE